MNSWDLQGKRAVVTGGSKGIGKAIVHEFLTLGAEVLFTARNAADIALVEREFLQAGFTVHGIAADAALDSDRGKLLEWISQRWGYLDILVNNAGINIHKRSTDYSEAEYMKIIGIDLLAPFELCRTLLPALQKGHGANVINLSSVAGTYDLQTGAPYGMAKAGLIQLSRSLAVEWARYKIRVNTVSPWFTATPLVEDVLNDARRAEAITSKTPLRRVAESEEVAAAVAFLAMDKASYITGHNFSVDGGVTCRLL
ncbi:MAG TPA: SDR family oxidoreductase [Chitinophagaceae bacterium]|nr:SDR family oxidoreductase [Chitinophagaceae bacterium]